MRRSGVTLTEVLVAIFIMGIGLLSLLTLFPLGALNMAQAIKDERVTMAAQNAVALARLNVTNVANPLTYPLTQNTGITSFYTTPGGTPSLVSLTTTGLNYPIYIDPQGVLLGSGRVGYLALGNTVHPGFVRSDLPNFIPSNSPNSQKLISRYLTALDDMTFTENGIADLSSGTLVREGRYTWAYLCRNPGVDVSVLMYEKRSLAGATGAPAIPPDETAYSVVSYPIGGNVVTLRTGSTAPPIKKGTWLLDATILDQNLSPPLVNQPMIIGGQLYRVVGVTDNGNGTFDVEVQLPFQPTLAPGFAPPNGLVTGGVMVVMEGVVEVFRAP